MSAAKKKREKPAAADLAAGVGKVIVAFAAKALKSEVEKRLKVLGDGLDADLAAVGQDIAQLNDGDDDES